MNLETNDITWNDVLKDESLETVIKRFQNPFLFQKLLADLIGKLFMDKNTANVIEIGAAFGITTALLPSFFNKTILDNSPVAVTLSRQFFGAVDQHVNIICADIFDLTEESNGYDIAFSAGLIEHFDFQKRVDLIRKMSIIVKKNGYVVIAYPNHNSIPYRIGYLYSRIRKKWPYPKEFKIGSLLNEAAVIPELIFDFEVTVDKDPIYYYLPFGIRFLLKRLDYFLNFQSYLKVIVFKKTLTS